MVMMMNDGQMSMLEMEYQLLGDALKKIPNEPHLINAQLTVLKKVRINH